MKRMRLPRAATWVAIAVLALIVVPLALADATNSTTDPGQMVGNTTSGGCVRPLSPTPVNCNQYAQKQDVFLNGSPSKSDAGTYFFAVLEPGGQPDANDAGDKNLSDTTCAPYACSATNPSDGTAVPNGDPATNREFSIDSAGKITNLGDHVFHQAGNGGLGSLSVYPFDDTDNAGGVYILAVCKISDSQSTQAIAVPAVKGSDCKYDAFKVQAPGTVELPSGAAITKDAAGADTKTFDWSIQKGVDKSEIDTSSSATANYTVTVTDNGFTPSDITVTGTITVTNPNVDPVTGDTIPMDITGVTDQLSGGRDCTVDDVPATLTDFETKLTYSCSLSSLPQGELDNTATVTWDAQDLSNGHLAAGSADFTFSDVQFTDTDVNQCITVDDAIDGNPAVVFGTICDGTGFTEADPAPSLDNFKETDDGTTFTFAYARTFNDTAGTCTTHDNTATIEETNASDDAEVKVCVGEDLGVSKTASPAFARDYDWSVVKSQTTSSTPIDSTASSVTVGYRVKATWSGPTDSGWQVTGTITVSNPNDWESVRLTGVSDSIDHSGNCSIDAADAANETATLARKGETGDSTTLGYKCTFSSNPGSGTNTATATWDDSPAYTPDDNASGTKAYDFSTVSPTVTHDTTTVTDAFNGGGALTLGVANINGTFTKAAGNTLTSWTQAYAPATKTFTFNYTRSVAVVVNTCTDYDNTATVGADATSGDNSSQASVVVCGKVTGGLTIGFWSNSNGKTVLCANDPGWRQLLNGTAAGAPFDGGSYLRNANGSPYTVPSGTTSCKTADTSFSNWLLGASSTNASYMLSAQLAGAILNVAYNGMDGSLCIAGNGGTPITIDNLIATVIAFLKLNGNTTAAGPARTLAVSYQTILNNLNNGKAFVTAGC